MMCKLMMLAGAVVVAIGLCPTARCQILDASESLKASHALGIGDSSSPKIGVAQIQAFLETNLLADMKPGPDHLGGYVCSFAFARLGSFGNQVLVTSIRASKEQSCETIVVVGGAGARRWQASFADGWDVDHLEDLVASPVAGSRPYLIVPSPFSDDNGRTKCLA